jgi:hypothetical protein
VTICLAARLTLRNTARLLPLCVFLEGHCDFAGTGLPTNLTVYRVTPYNLSGVASKDTGDPAGDLFFRLGDEFWLRSLCRNHPELHYDRCALFYSGAWVGRV